MYGLDAEDIRNIKTAIAKVPAISKVILYGSRAKGNYRNGSDIDFTLLGKDLTLKNGVYPLMDELEELYLPYTFDISIYRHIDNDDLIGHIGRVGKVFYRSNVELPEGWKTVNLTDVCAFENGDRGKNYPGRKAFVSHGIPFINAGHLSEDGISMTTMNFIPKKKFDLLGSGKVQEGDLLFCLRGSLGKHAVVEKLYEGAIASSLVIVRADANRLNNYFLSAYFCSRMCADMIDRYKNGAAQPNLSAKSLGLFQIHLPPLPEQKRIVAILDKAFEGINQAVANAEKNLANARELFESYLNTIFTQKGDGWARVKVGEVCESIIDCINKTAPKVDEPTPYKMIRTTNVRDGIVNLDVVKYVTEETYEKWTRRQVPQYGDVLLTREAPLGKTGMLLSKDRVFLGQRLVSYRTNPRELNSWFLLYAFQSPDIQTQIKGLASGSTVQHMRVPHTKKLMLSLPSVDRQVEIVASLNYMRKYTNHLQSIYQKKLTALKELKQSILQKAFSGELTQNSKK